VAARVQDNLQNELDPSARRVLWLTGVAHASSHSWELIFPAIAVPMAKDLGLEVAQTMPLAFGLYLLFGLGAPFAGWLTDRIGSRRVLILCLLLGGLSGLGVWLAPTIGWVTIALAGVGAAASLYHPAGLALLSRRFVKTGRALAINGMAGNVGLAATPFLAGLIASLFDWRTAYVALCAPGLLLGVIFSLFGFEELPSKEADRAPLEDDRGFRLSPLLMLAVAMTAGGLAYRLQSLVIPALLQERIPDLSRWASHLSLPSVSNPGNVAATLLTSVAYTTGMFGQWIGGKIADARPLVTSYLAFHVFALPCIVVAALATGVPLVLALFAYLFFSQGMQPVENSLVAGFTRPAWRGRAYALKFILAFGVGSFGTFVVKLVEPYGGLGASLGAAAIAELVLICAAAMVWRLASPTSPRALEGAR
jgi:MFS transporter, FSR family, fosmidomycin resistance protein